jgi:hypothetical protein
MSPRAALSALAVVAALAAGCKKAAKPAPTAAMPVALFVDDRQVATSATLGATARPLVEVVPGLPDPASWLAVIAIDADGKATTVLAPAKDHAGTPPALAAVDGQVQFGLAKGGQLERPVARVAKVIVKTQDDRGAIAAELAAQGGGGHGGGDSAGHRHDGEGERPVPTAELVIAIKGPQGESTFTGDKLVPLPTITAPTGDTETPGWSLVDILAAAGLGGAKAVSLLDSEGAGLRLEGADFDRAATVLYVKMNRGGQLRFRRYAKRGEAWEMTGELRGLSKITVVE